MEKNWAPFAHNKQRIFCVLLPELHANMRAACLWLCYSAQVMWKTHSSSSCEEQIYTIAPL